MPRRSTATRCAISATTIDHRGPEFGALGLRVLKGIQQIFQTRHPVVIYPASGTGAWEAALVDATVGRFGRVDVLVNISGMLADLELTGSIPTRVYLDLDPAFIQMWQTYDGVDMRFAGHTHFVTVGREMYPRCARQWRSPACT